MSGWYDKKTFVRLLAEATQRWAAREALFHEGRRFTFNDLDAQVDRVAKGLVAIGIERGDKVTLWMPNRPEWLFAFLALSKIGAITVPADTPFRSVDLENPVGHIIYTPGGHVATIAVGTDRKASASPNPSDLERAELLRSCSPTAGPTVSMEIG